MHHLKKTIRSAVAMLAIASTFLTTTSAFAALPGEGNSYTHELIFTGAFDSIDHDPIFSDLATNSNYNEARTDDQSLLRVWRGQSDNSVWYSINNGVAIRFPGTQTSYAPTVVVNNGSYMVLQTGVDNNIYYTMVSRTGAWTGVWEVAHGNTTDAPVSVVRYPAVSDPDNDEAFMVYLGTDGRVWGTWFDLKLGWAAPRLLASQPLLAFSAPSIAYNPVGDNLWVVARGTDDSLWITHQFIGQSNWNNWQSLGQNLLTSPTIAVEPVSGNMLISFVDQQENVFYRRFDANMNPYDANWSQDSTGWQTWNPVSLTLVGRIIYALLTGTNRQGYYKPVTQF